MSTNKLLQRARVLLVGSGRMGHIRANAIYSNPRFEFCGIVDANVNEAEKLGAVYQVGLYWLLMLPLMASRIGSWFMIRISVTQRILPCDICSFSLGATLSISHRGN